MCCNSIATNIFLQYTGCKKGFIENFLNFGEAAAPSAPILGNATAQVWGFKEIDNLESVQKMVCQGTDK